MTKLIRLRKKDNHDWQISVAIDSPIIDMPQFEPIPYPLKGMTKEQALALFGTDFTGVNKDEDGTYYADEMAVERARVLNRFETEKHTGIEDPDKK